MHAVTIDESYVCVNKPVLQNGKCEKRTYVLIEH
jgi:hypothetical protein